MWNSSLQCIFCLLQRTTQTQLKTHFFMTHDHPWIAASSPAGTKEATKTSASNIYIYNLCNPLLDQEGVLEITIPQYRLVDPNPRLTQALYRMATLMCTVYIILYYILAVVVPPATHSHSFQLPTLSSTFIISNSNKHIRPGWCFTFLIRTAAGHFWSWCAITLV